MNPWTYLVLWAKGPAGWFPFDQTTVKRMSSAEAVAAVWRLRALWNNYTDPISVFRHDGASWKTAAVHRDPVKQVALASA
jgi:hypothetical protein